MVAQLGWFIGSQHRENSGSGRIRKSDTSHFVFLSCWLSPPSHSATQKNNCTRLVARSYQFARIIYKPWCFPTHLVEYALVKLNRIISLFGSAKKWKTLWNHHRSHLQWKGQSQIHSKSLKPAPAPSIISQRNIYIYIYIYVILDSISPLPDLSAGSACPRGEDREKPQEPSGIGLLFWLEGWLEGTIWAFG